MPLRLGTGLRNIVVNTLTAQFAGGTLRVYSGAQPATADSAATGTLLAEVVLPSPAFGAAVAGAAALSGVWTAIAIASGLAGWARLSSSDGLYQLDVSINSAELFMDYTDIIINEQLTIQAFTITQPA